MYLFHNIYSVLFILPFMRPLFSSQPELSNFAFYFQDGGKTGAQKDRSFGKYTSIFLRSKLSYIIIKGWNFILSSFSGWIIFFSIRRAITAYVGELRLSQYILSLLSYPDSHINAVHCLYWNSCTWSSSYVIVIGQEVILVNNYIFKNRTLRQWRNDGRYASC